MSGESDSGASVADTNSEVGVESSATTRPRRRSLRLWPGIVLVALYWLGRGGSTLVEGSPSVFFLVYFIAPLVLTVGLFAWWLFASRIGWLDRLLGVGVYLVAGAAAVVVCGDDFPLMTLIIYALPVVASVWVGWLVFSFPAPWALRRAVLLVAIVAAWGAFALLRADGMDGEFVADFNWRWTPTPEDRFLAELRDVSASKGDDETTIDMSAPVVLQAGDWPEFRGPQRDGVVHDVRIATDWTANPPEELWRKRVGPNWSSFCVVGDRLFTQEQRGEEEVTLCYDAVTGAEVWAHSDEARFTEVIAGPGPRATPTFANGLLYVQGASGILNCLDAATGKKIWSRNLVEEHGATVPIWGYSASPLVDEGVVTVYAGAEGKAVAAYDAIQGDLLWTGGEGLFSYSSPQSATLDGVEQTLMATDVGLYSFVPNTGEILWLHEWNSDGVARIVQPAVIDGTDLLIGTGMGVGTRRIHVRRDGDAWKTEEVWTTKQFKPYFNDFVVHGGSLYGFDGPIFACLDVKDGRVQWRTRGYGSGQVLLLGEQGLLIVVTEKGELALLKADAEEQVELARLPAISGKTWNHPVVVGDRLFVKNGEEMVCFRLPVESATP